MRVISEYLYQYIRSINWWVFFAIIILLALLVGINYGYGLNEKILALDSNLLRVALYSLMLFLIFGSSYLISVFFKLIEIPRDNYFYFIFFSAIILFAAKMGIRIDGNSSLTMMQFPGGRYWNLVLQWPVKAFIIFAAIFFIWKKGRYQSPTAGMFNAKDIHLYIPLLLLMIPLLYCAAGDQGFQNSYPKVKNVFFIIKEVDTPLPWYLLYELFYGIDFFSIELFFRGFLVLAFVRYAGIHAILPMAAFYCVIHFGKPLPECISSFFGGLILGAVVYHSRSIWGGLLVHLGIAWAMELLVWARA